MYTQNVSTINQVAGVNMDIVIFCWVKNVRSHLEGRQATFVGIPFFSHPTV